MLHLNSPWGGWQCQVPREGRHLTGTEGLQLTSFHGLVKSSRLLRARAPALCGHRGNSLVGRVTLQCLPKTQTPHSTDHFVCPQKSHCTDRKVSYRKGKILSISSWQFSERKRRLHGGKKTCTYGLLSENSNKLEYFSTPAWLWQQKQRLEHLHFLEWENAVPLQ